MKAVFRLVVLFLLFAAPGVSGAEPVSEPQFLVYYQASFDGDRRSPAPIFGIRLDRVLTDSAKRLEFDQLLQSPGFAELRMNRRGLKSFTLAGVHYDSSPVVARAAEEAEAGEAPASEEQPQEQPQKQTQEQSSGTEAEAEGEKSLDDYIQEVPLGYLIGIGIGVVIFTGVGS